MSEKFGRVTKRFGHGLKNAIKGSVIGISLGLLAKLLNPLNELEDRIKKLLGQGEDAKELANKIGATPGELQFAQFRANALGIPTDKFNELITAFSKVVDAQQQEVDERKKKKIGGDPLVSQDNRLKGFQRALLIIDDLMKTDPAKARIFQRELFGDTLSGNEKKLFDPTFKREIFGNRYNVIDKLNSANNKLNTQNERYTEGSAKQNLQDFIRSANAVTPGVISGTLSNQQRDLNKDFKELTQYQILKNAADQVQEIVDILNGIKGYIFQALSWLKENGVTISNAVKLFKAYMPGASKEKK